MLRTASGILKEQAPGLVRKLSEEITHTVGQNIAEDKYRSYRRNSGSNGSIASLSSSGSGFWGSPSSHATSTNNNSPSQATTLRKQ